MVIKFNVISSTHIVMKCDIQIFLLDNDEAHNTIPIDTQGQEVKQIGTHTSTSHIRTTASSPALIIVVFKGPQTALFILPSGPLIVSTESPVSAQKTINKKKSS